MKHIKRIGIGLLSIFLILFIALNIYASNPYKALDEMHSLIEENNYENVVVTDEKDAIYFKVENPIANIIFVPGGLVEPDAYSYLAIELANNNYNVTISKAPYNLAILNPNKPLKYIDESLDNIMIGHSLGGVVASMSSSGEAKITKVITLGSYPINDLTDKQTLMITAEHDIAMNEDSFNESLVNVNAENILIDIEGGNHAQFGWYGPQKGDGEAEIDTITQQNIVVELILDFLQNS